ncbi:MAG: hypothetical protein GX664_06165 [Bacteroidales bacterium]|nr:hypothetical protein [Bacteroidales bacterium]
MIFQLQDDSCLIPIYFREPSTIVGYAKGDFSRTHVSVDWSSISGIYGSYNFAEDGDFEIICKDAKRIIPLQFGRPLDAKFAMNEAASTIYGYRADIIQTDIVGKRMIEHISIYDIDHITGSYNFSPIIFDINKNL